MAASFFRGTSFEQDARFSNKWKKLLASTKFPEIYSQQVQTKTVQLSAIRSWVSSKLQQLLGFEDDVVVDFVLSFLESYDTPDPRELHLNMSGFLEGKTFGFMQELWSLLLEAQQEAKVCDGKVVSAGVPPSLVEEMQKQLEEKQRTKESVEEQLKHRAENSPLHDIEPNKLPTVIETRESNKPSNWDSDSVGLNVRQQTESARADRTRRCSERRHSRRSSRRKSSHSRDRHRHRRHERSPRKRHHRRHLSSHRHRSHKNKVRKDSHSDSDNASTHSEENSSGRKELKKDLNKGDLETRTEKVDSGNKEEPSAVLKENSVENDNSRDSLLAELARVERETELRRKALESMHKRTK